ncbi:MAG: SPOR domain-containing protein [bacterium]
MNAETKKQATRRRSGRSKPTRISRTFIIAGAVILFLAIFLFWDRTGNRSGGIGENYSVVTASNGQQSNSLMPGGGATEVDIENQVETLVPEQQRGERPTAVTTKSGSESRSDSPAETTTPDSDPPAATGPATETGDTTTPARQPETPAASEQTTDTTPPPATTPAAAASSPAPAAAGPWIVQVGAFGNVQNAENLQTRLETAGFPTFIRTTSRTDGQLLYRVCIGYFPSRDDAESFARHNRQAMGEEGIPLHR